MKKFKIIILALVMMFLITGCNKTVDNFTAEPENIDELLIEDASEDLIVGKLGSIYEDLKAEHGNEYATRKIIDIIAMSELKLEEDEDLQAIYEARVEEMFEQLRSDEAYLKNGVFDEKLFADFFRAESFNVTCDSGYGPRYDYDGINVEEYLLCNYNDVIEKEIKSEVLMQLLSEQYYYDKVFVDTKNYINKKRVRNVEYFAITKDNKNEALDFMTSAVSKLISGDADFDSLSQDWYQSKLDELQERYDKIGTKDDSSFAIYKEFAHDGSKFRTIEEGLLAKKREIYATQLIDSVIFTNDKKTGLNINLVDRILNENVLETKTFKIGDDYYLLSPLAIGTTNANDTIVLNENKYYFIKVTIVNEESSDEEIREVVKLFKEDTKILEEGITYYFSKYKIDIHDEAVYEYLEAKYPTVFVK